MPYALYMSGRKDGANCYYGELHIQLAGDVRKYRFDYDAVEQAVYIDGERMVASVTADHLLQWLGDFAMNEFAKAA